jgi:hypothetical protein
MGNQRFKRQYDIAGVELDLECLLLPSCADSIKAVALYENIFIVNL